MSTPETTIPILNRAGRRSLARTGSAIGGAGVVVAGSAAALLTALAGSAGASTTITVDSNGDGVATAANCTDGIPNNCTIRDAAAAAVDGDTITFDSSITNITLTNGTITTQSVNITGPGAESLTITTTGATGAYDLFLIEGTGDVVISGLTVTKNRIDARNHGPFTLDGVTISGSTGSYGGALGLYSSGALTIFDSTFENNTATYGGAIAIENGQDAAISGSTFTNNHAQQSGGAVHTDWSNDITITNSLISGNTSGNGGGALELKPGNLNAVITIADTTIDSNHSDTYGGGLDADQTVNINNTTVSNNSANAGAGLNFGITNATINNSTISANTAAYGGGGVFINADSSIVINQSTITANIANGTTINYGGAGLSIGSDTTVVTMSGTIVSGNTAGVAGSADFGLYTTDPTATGSFTATNSLIGEADSRVTINGTDNVTSTDPMLGALADNGGPTKTMAPLTGSPAINAGPNQVATFPDNEFDQRGTGFARVVGGLVDIGAFEIQPTQEPTTTTTTTTTTITDEPVAPAFTG